jgi:hypothetical protein
MTCRTSHFSRRHSAVVETFKPVWDRSSVNSADALGGNTGSSKLLLQKLPPYEIAVEIYVQN